MSFSSERQRRQESLRTGAWSRARSRRNRMRMAVEALEQRALLALTGAVGIPVAAVEGQPLNNVPVATLTDTSTTDTAASLTATINWGDGTTSTGSLVALGSNASGTSFQVSGSHTYTL